eukprot:CAMPEP_0170357974 /NCGR_PEP_ID=MMETSP0117_2-20130122/1990_1 /TAXON_ID=400756 /ORGANISM="Durinskia baltica, Strain CSIRO CS-38" /LENGTH=229 /DNA_ID=CAMNT_0010612171 /DNA_START=308 /DNA_END=994 /DNA_ORIENTATION=+
MAIAAAELIEVASGEFEETPVVSSCFPEFGQLSNEQLRAIDECDVTADDFLLLNTPVVCKVVRRAAEVREETRRLAAGLLAVAEEVRSMAESVDEQRRAFDSRAARMEALLVGREGAPHDAKRTELVEQLQHAVHVAEDEAGAMLARAVEFDSPIMNMDALAAFRDAFVLRKADRHRNQALLAWGNAREGQPRVQGLRAAGACTAVAVAQGPAPCSVLQVQAQPLAGAP